jgi:hypothetical protein
VITIVIDCAAIPKVAAMANPTNTPRNMPAERRSPPDCLENSVITNTTHHHNIGMLPIKPNSAMMWRNQLCALSVASRFRCSSDG